MAKYGEQKALEGPVQTKSMIIQPSFAGYQQSSRSSNSGSRNSSSSDDYPKLKGLDGENKAHMAQYLDIEAQEMGLRREMTTHLLDNNHKIDPKVWGKIQQKRDVLKRKKAMLQAGEQGLINKKERSKEVFKNLSENQNAYLAKHDGSLLTFGEFAENIGGKIDDEEQAARPMLTNELGDYINKLGHVPEWMLNYRHVDVEGYQDHVREVFKSAENLITKDKRLYTHRANLMDYAMGGGDVKSAEAIIESDNTGALGQKMAVLKQEINNDPDLKRAAVYMYENYKKADPAAKTTFDNFLTGEMTVVGNSFYNNSIDESSALRAGIAKNKERQSLWINRMIRGEFSNNSQSYVIANSETEVPINYKLANDMLAILNGGDGRSFYEDYDDPEDMMRQAKDAMDAWELENLQATKAEKEKHAQTLITDFITQIPYNKKDLNFKDKVVKSFDDFIGFISNDGYMQVSEGKEITRDRAIYNTTQLSSEQASDIMTFEPGKHVSAIKNRQVKMGGMHWKTFNDIPLFDNAIILGSTQYIDNIQRVNPDGTKFSTSGMVIEIAVPMSDYNAKKGDIELDYYKTKDNMDSGDYTEDLKDLNENELRNLGIYNTNEDGGLVSDFYKRSVFGMSNKEMMIIQVITEYDKADHGNDEAMLLEKKYKRKDGYSEALDSDINETPNTESSKYAEGLSTR